MSLFPPKYLFEELKAKAYDLENFYRIPADFRDLNYTKYVQTGGTSVEKEEYNSHNTHRLTVNELKEILLKLDYVKDALNSHTQINKG